MEEFPNRGTSLSDSSPSSIGTFWISIAGQSYESESDQLEGNMPKKTFKPLLDEGLLCEVQAMEIVHHCCHPLPLTKSLPGE